MGDKAQGGKEEGRGGHKPERASKNFRKNEELLIEGVWGLVPSRRSTCVQYQINICTGTYPRQDLPVFIRHDLSLRLTSRAPPFTFLLLSACSPSLLYVLHAFLCPRMDALEMESVPT